MTTTTTEPVKRPCQLSAHLIRIIVWIGWVFLAALMSAILFSCNHQAVIAFQPPTTYPAPK